MVVDGYTYESIYAALGQKHNRYSGRCVYYFVHSIHFKEGMLNYGKTSENTSSKLINYSIPDVHLHVFLGGVIKSSAMDTAAINMV